MIAFPPFTVFPWAQRPEISVEVLAKVRAGLLRQIYLINPDAKRAGLDHLGEQQLQKWVEKHVRSQVVIRLKAMKIALFLKKGPAAKKKTSPKGS